MLLLLFVCEFEFLLDDDGDDDDEASVFLLVEGFEELSPEPEVIARLPPFIDVASLRAL